jgi:hypothetical protein
VFSKLNGKSPKECIPELVEYRVLISIIRRPPQAQLISVLEATEEIQ